MWDAGCGMPRVLGYILACILCIFSYELRLIKACMVMDDKAARLCGRTREERDDQAPGVSLFFSFSVVVGWYEVCKKIVSRYAGMQARQNVVKPRGARDEG